MQRLSGLLMILAGTGFGSYAMAPDEGGKATTFIDNVTRISAPATAKPFVTPPGTVTGIITRTGISRTGTGTTEIARATPAAATQPEPATPHRIRVFSPSAPLLAAIDDNTASESGTRIAPSTWSAVIVRTAQAEDGSRQPLRTTYSSPRAGDKTARAALAADLQRELKRVGCYGGAINGGWTTSTRRAMSAFMQRVNASLPFDEPDYILLSLVQTHDGIACGACPQGEQQAASGQCLPTAVLAEIDAAAKPRADSAAKARRVAKSKHTAPVAVAAEELPWLKKPAAAATPPAVTKTLASIDRPAFTGRMSVGGPVDHPVMPKASLASAEAGSPNAWDDIEVDTVAAEPEPQAYRAPAKLKRPLKSAHKSKLANVAAKYDRKREKKAWNRRYASGFGGKGRRGQPRAGTARYNVMLSLGGIY